MLWLWVSASLIHKNVPEEDYHELKKQLFPALPASTYTPQVENYVKRVIAAVSI